MSRNRVPVGVSSGGQFSASARDEAGLRLVEDPVLGSEPPLIEFDEVYHVGTFDRADRKTKSYEGSGVSVSVHPEDWQAITPLPGDTWTMTRLDGEPLRFVSWHDLNEKDRDRVRAWGLGRGWVTRARAWRVTYFDDELDRDISFEYPTRDEALVEADGFIEDLNDPDNVAEVLSEQAVWRATDSFPDDRAPTSDDPTDLLLGHWIRDQRPDLDGVWWDDDHDPDTLSCPRGVLVHDLIDADDNDRYAAEAW